MSANTPEPNSKQSLRRQLGDVPSLTSLLVSFLRLGATAFGGPAMVAYIRQMAVDRKGWLSGRTFDDGVALCQAVPGATAMQTAAYVGLNVRGVSGAAVCFIGFGLPAFGLMLLFSVFYSHAHKLPAVIAAFDGLQAIVVAIVANAAVTFGKTTLKSWRQVLIAALAVILFGWGTNPLIVVTLAALMGYWLLRANVTVEPAPVASMTMPPTTRSVVLILGATVVLLSVIYFLQRPLFDLVAMMVRIDLFAFGGGFASVPLLFNEVVSTRHWLDGPTLSDAIVLGQVTPGPIIITATFVGYLVHGMIGAIGATLGVFLPSFLMVIMAAPHFDRLRASPIFAGLIGGALCAFPGLLLIVTIHFAQNINWDLTRMILGVASFIALRLGANIFWVVVVGAGLSLAFCR